MVDRVLIISSGVYSTPPSKGDAVAKVAYELSVSLSKYISITVFDIKDIQRDRYEVLSDHLCIFRTIVSSRISGVLRHAVFGLLSAIYAVRNRFSIVICQSQWQVFFNKLFLRKVVFISHYNWSEKKIIGEKLASYISDCPIAISKHIYDYMKNINAKVILINNGVNIDKYVPKIIRKCNGILYVGKINEGKNILYLIKNIIR